MPARPLWQAGVRIARFFFRDPRLFLRYISVGGAAALLELTLFSLLYEGLGWALLPANGLALAVAIVVSFILQKTWTFRIRGGGARQLRWYLFMQGIAVILNNLLMVLFVEHLGWYAPLAKIVEIGLVFLWNFSFCRLVVFVPPR